MNWGGGVSPWGSARDGAVVDYVCPRFGSSLRVLAGTGLLLTRRARFRFRSTLRPDRGKHVLFIGGLVVNGLKTDELRRVAFVVTVSRRPPLRVGAGGAGVNSQLNSHRS